MAAILSAGTRVNANWLASAPLQKVFAALERDGHKVRIVGGAIRNALIGRPVTEIDIATTALPNEIIESAGRTGLGAHPTGIAHGTVTVVADSEAFEVTTLRRDVETDGRHATVAFTTDWVADAMRRDFTINALYCGLDGGIEDYTSGLDDIRHRRVRFIGDARARINEDVLRILRFFRFSADFGKGRLDANGLAAASALKDGLKNLSRERVRGEILKLFAAPKAAEVVRVMDANGILDLAIGTDCDVKSFERLQAIELGLGQPADPLCRLAALAIRDTNDATAMASQLKLSNAEAARLQSATAVEPGIDPKTSEAAARRALYRLGADAYRRATRVAWARSSASPTDPSWRARILLPDRWKAPPQPFSGADVVALGISTGPLVGQILRAFEDWWIARDFPADPPLNQAQLETIAKDAAG